jgi:Endomembrane protein 70
MAHSHGVLECSETYQYYSLPFCAPNDKKYRSEGFGEVLAGDRTVNSLYTFAFAKDNEQTNLCHKTLTTEEVKKFRTAVAAEYYFQVRCCSHSTLLRWCCAALVLGFPAAQSKSLCCEAGMPCPKASQQGHRNAGVVMLPSQCR